MMQPIDAAASWKVMALKTHSDVQARFVAEPVRSLSDALLKLEFVVGEDALDSIDEDIIQGVIAFLRSQVAT